MADFARGEAWLLAMGRPLDLALWRYETSGDPEPVLAALRSYVNADGGFGHGLEPDVRLEASSVIATTVALQVLSRCGAAASHPLVAGALRYLSETYDASARAWPIVPAIVSEAPHAPWWGYRPAVECPLNPKAEILGYLYRWHGFFTEDQRAALTADVLELVIAADELEMHDLLVIERMLHTPGFPMAQHQEAVAHFYMLARTAVAAEPAAWQDYGLTPLGLVKDPRHPLANEISGLSANLTYLSEEQEADGSWSPTWSWYGHHEDEWPNAERDIRSMVTAEALCLLRRFDRG